MRNYEKLEKEKRLIVLPVAVDAKKKVCEYSNRCVKCGKEYHVEVSLQYVLPENLTDTYRNRVECENCANCSPWDGYCGLGFNEEAIGRILDHERIHSKKEPFTPYLDKAFTMAIKALKEQRPHGEWITKGAVGDGTWCSVCDTNIKLFPNRYSFCPNCGADMREGEAKC